MTSTVHISQGDTLHRVATEVSYGNMLYKLWDKGQVVVLLSRTRWAIDLTFVGDNRYTIKFLVTLIQVKTQYMDYMEKIISLISTTTQNNMIPRSQVSQESRSIFRYDKFPFEMNNVSLPQCNTAYCYMLII